MAIINVRGRLIIESAGPIWHLVGSVKRDKRRSNMLTLIREVDPLSKMIRAVGSAHLPTVHITTLSGLSATLLRAKILSGGVQSVSRGSGNSTRPHEELAFLYGAIEVKYTNGSTSTSDDWDTPG